MLGIDPISPHEGFDRLASLGNRVVIVNKPSMLNQITGRTIWTVTYDGPHGPVEASAWTLLEAIYVATGGDLWERSA